MPSLSRRLEGIRCRPCATGTDATARAPKLSAETSVRIVLGPPFSFTSPLAATRPCCHGGSRGGGDGAVRNAERVIGTIKVTRVQREHVMHLWPCPSGIC